MNFAHSCKKLCIWLLNWAHSGNFKIPIFYWKIGAQKDLLYKKCKLLFSKLSPGQTKIVIDYENRSKVSAWSKLVFTSLVHDDSMSLRGAKAELDEVGHMAPLALIGLRIQEW